MLPDRVSNPGPLTYASGALPIALRGPANPGPLTYESGALSTALRGPASSKGASCSTLKEIISQND